MPEESRDEIAAKRRRFEAERANPGLWALQIAADLYTAAFLVPKTGGVPANRDTVMIPTTGHVWEALAGHTVYGPVVGRAQDLAGRARAFHWPLEFPDVMAQGGFDVVLGNPPWERAKLQDVEFFSTRDAEIATAPTASKRKSLIAALAQSLEGTLNRKLWDTYQYAKRNSEAIGLFCRASQKFPLSARGDLNTYALFTELGVSLLSARGGLGIVVPSGIATESATSDLFGNLSERRLIKTFFDFENRGGFFHGLHTKHKFAVVCVAPPGAERIDLCFFATGSADLHDPRKRIALTTDDIALFNPNTKTLPILRSERDLLLLRKLYQIGVPLVNSVAKLDPWSVDFLRMFDMTLDSALFSEIEAPGNLPLYEAKMFWHFDHRWANSTETTETHLPDSIKANTATSASSRFYVDKSEVEVRLRTRK